MLQCPYNNGFNELDVTCQYCKHFPQCAIDNENGRKQHSSLKVSAQYCENMSKDKVIIMTHPDNKDFVDNVMTVVEDEIEGT